jgi:hypothetical protein
MALTKDPDDGYPAFIYRLSLNLGMSPEEASQAYEWAKDLEEDEFYDVHNNYYNNN